MRKSNYYTIEKKKKKCTIQYNKWICTRFGILRNNLKMIKNYLALNLGTNLCL